MALRCLYPQDSGQTLDLSQDLEMSAVFSELLVVRQTLDKHSQLEAQLKQRIQQRIGDATKAVFETGDVTWKRSKDGSALDVAARCSKTSRNWRSATPSSNPVRAGFW